MGSYYDLSSVYSTKRSYNFSGDIKLSDDQINALNIMESFAGSDEQVLVLEGSAGTGKTTILNEYIQYLDSNDYNFVLCAPTNRAALVIEDATGYGAITIHKLLSLSPNIEIFNLDYKSLKFFSTGMNEVPSNGIVIIDEASMINDEIYELLIDFCKKANTKLIFIGDKAQLQAINNYSSSKVFELKNKISLTNIHRQAQDNQLLPLLSKLRNRVIPRFNPIQNALDIFYSPKEFISTIIPIFKEGIKKQDINHIKLIAYTNSRVNGFNTCIRKFLWKSEEPFIKNEIITSYDNFEYNNYKFYNSLDYIVTDAKVVDKKIPLYMKLPGYMLEMYDPIYKCIKSVFVLLPDIPTDYLDSLSQLIESTRFEAINAKNYGNKTKASSLWRSYFSIINSFAVTKDMIWDNRTIKKKTFDYGYAMTVHKVQGSSLSNIAIDMNNIMTCRNKDEIRQMQYVSLSRTKNKAYMLC